MKIFNKILLMLLMLFLSTPNAWGMMVGRDIGILSKKIPALKTNGQKIAFIESPEFQSLINHPELITPADTLARNLMNFITNQVVPLVTEDKDLYRLITLYKALQRSQFPILKTEIAGVEEDLDNARKVLRNAKEALNAAESAEATFKAGKKVYIAAGKTKKAKGEAKKAIEAIRKDLARAKSTLQRAKTATALISRTQAVKMNAENIINETEKQIKLVQKLLTRKKEVEPGKMVSVLPEEEEVEEEKEKEPEEEILLKVEKAEQQAKEAYEKAKQVSTLTNNILKSLQLFSPNIPKEKEKRENLRQQISNLLDKILLLSGEAEDEVLPATPAEPADIKNKRESIKNQLSLVEQEVKKTKTAQAKVEEKEKELEPEIKPEIKPPVLTKDEEEKISKKLNNLLEQLRVFSTEAYKLEMAYMETAAQSTAFEAEKLKSISPEKVPMNIQDRIYHLQEVHAQSLQTLNSLKTKIQAISKQMPPKTTEESKRLTLKRTEVNNFLATQQKILDSTETAMGKVTAILTKFPSKPSK